MAEYLSEHFTLAEMIASDTAKARGINNNPTELHKKVLKHTCEYMLEPLRKLLNEKYTTYQGKKVKEVTLKVTSGYRSAALNAAVGGVSSSQHCKGCATDIEASVVYANGKRVVIPYNELYEGIKASVKSGKVSVDQCIMERAYDKVRKCWYYWVHVSHSDRGKTCDRREFWRYNNGVYSFDCKLNSNDFSPYRILKKRCKVKRH